MPTRSGVELLALDGGASRTNLTFEVRPTTKQSKLSDVLNVIDEFLPQEGRSGVVVYCSSRKETERVAEFLKSQGMDAEHFHAGLTADDKQTVQERFRVGELRVIAATNAFGMGIDKPDIRLVVHADIPGSLENYLQEAGRAGRDREDANCVLLFAADDVERQFRLTARSRLARHQIGAILKALRRIDERTKKTGKVVATAGEIVRSEKDHEFDRNNDTDDTRVKTAVSWLEEAKLVSREENRVQIFPSSLQVHTLEEAKRRLDGADITGTRRKELLSIVTHLMSSPADEGISTDVLCGLSGLSAGALSKAMADLETLGIARNDVAITVFVHVGVANASIARLSQASNLEKDLIALMQEMAPEADDTVPNPLNFAATCQRLRDQGHPVVQPDLIDKLLRGMARDGRGQDGGQGNIRLRKVSRDTLLVTIQRPWKVISQTSEVRWQAAALLLNYLIGRLDKGARGKDLQIETTVGDLLAQLTQDGLLKTSGVKDMTKLLERSLLWLHEQGVLTLGKGMTVFRSAMTVYLDQKGGQFTQSDFLPLEEHYAEQTLQTRVMASYAETGLKTMMDASRLSEDYFLLNKDQFMKRWMPGMGRETKRQTTSKSWDKIVDGLGNKVQQNIVADDREQTNVLVLAGPGSGKTRVLVHRIAYLLRVRREDPQGVLVLVYNRHAAAEIRVRLRNLIGDEANGVTISTCHSLAMKLVGASFSGVRAASEDFDNVVNEAVRQLEGEGLSKSEAEAQRDSLIQGCRWILVDEYQDIGSEEYALISAVAGRSLDDADQKLSLFAVGDDDQNIYAFKGASIDYIRRFEEDYKAKPAFLIENYRSTRHIVDASNTVIASASDRMKTDHDIRINKARSQGMRGGRMEGADTVAQGRVQILDVPTGVTPQAVAAVDELMRLSHLDPKWDWRRTAVVSRNWKELNAVRAYAEHQGIEVEMANETLPNIWRLRETQSLVAGLRQKAGDLLGIQGILDVLNKQTRNKWIDLLAEGIAELARELGTKSMSVPDIVEWLAEWSRDTRGQQRGLLLLTAHRAKGLEFDHVVILNGGWDNSSGKEDLDAPRRLFYVAMTRAQQTLTVMSSGPHALLSDSVDAIVRRKVMPDVSDSATDHNIYQLPSLDMVFLSFAGRKYDRHEIHAAVAGAKVGDPVTLHFDGKFWTILDGYRRVLGSMSGSWNPPVNHHLLEGYVGAIVKWRKSDNDEKHRDQLKRDEWESVLPEFIFRSGEPGVPIGEPAEMSEEESSQDDVTAPETKVQDPPNTGSSDVNTEACQPEILTPLIQAGVSNSQTWNELIDDLLGKGITLVPKGGGLVVQSAQEKNEICKLSALGFRYIDLIRHFGDGFPGHPQEWLVEKAFNENYVPKGAKRKAKHRKGKRRQDEDISLIED